MTALPGRRTETKKTVGRLSDGRQILFFDEAGAPDRIINDRRNLPPLHTHSQLRHDRLLDDWVVIASHRQSRTFLPPVEECPLCPSRNGRQTEIPTDDYDVVVFENRFPSLTGSGVCEVVCFTSDHDASFGSLRPERVRTIIDAWADRTSALQQRGGVEQVFCFENRGEEIGVTLAHPHGQIYGYPFVPPRIRRTLDVVAGHFDRTGRNLFEDVVAAERTSGERIVTQSECWTAFVPSAARWPFEVHVYPHRRVPDLVALTGDERDDLAVIYLDVLRRLDGVFSLPMPYIAAWHQAPTRNRRDLAALHVEIFSSRRAPEKLKYLAGSEAGMDVFINDVTPERAAALLREA